MFKVPLYYIHPYLFIFSACFILVWVMVDPKLNPEHWAQGRWIYPECDANLSTRHRITYTFTPWGNLAKPNTFSSVFRAWALEETHMDMGRTWEWNPSQKVTWAQVRARDPGAVMQIQEINFVSSLMFSVKYFRAHTQQTASIFKASLEMNPNSRLRPVGNDFLCQIHS